MEEIRARLTPGQEEDLVKFRKAIADVLKPHQNNEHYLLRWLVARNFNIGKAEDMFRKSMVWRKKWGADTILKDFKPPEALKKYYPGGVIGVDKAGFPVYVIAIGKMDMRGISLCVKRADIIRFFIYFLEELMEDIKKADAKHAKMIDQVVCIQDMEGFGLKQLFQPGMDIFREVFALMESNYPQFLRKFYVIKAPAVYPVLFKVLQPFLRKDTQAKINVLGSRFEDSLLEMIDASVLPKNWGGDATDPDGDPRCILKVNPGGEVPSSYYAKDSTALKELNVLKTTVAQKSTFNVENQVAKQGQILKWIFWTEKGDLKYSVLYNSGDYQEIIKPEARVGCHMVPEDDCVECKHPGTYVLRFDNSYSWFNEKQLSYCVEIVDVDSGDQSPEGDGMMSVDL